MNAPAAIRSVLDAIDGKEKFILVVGAGIVNTALLLAHVIAADTYMDLTNITVGAYILGHSAEAIAESRAEYRGLRPDNPDA